MEIGGLESIFLRFLVCLYDRKVFYIVFLKLFIWSDFYFINEEIGREFDVRNSVRYGIM